MIFFLKKDCGAHNVVLMTNFIVLKIEPLKQYSLLLLEALSFIVDPPLSLSIEALTYIGSYGRDRTQCSAHSASTLPRWGRGWTYAMHQAHKLNDRPCEICCLIIVYNFYVLRTRENINYVRKACNVCINNIISIHSQALYKLYKPVVTLMHYAFLLLLK